MDSSGRGEITAMLAAWKAGDGDALDRVVSRVYPQVRRIARQFLARRGPGQSLESAALAHEAYLKLVRSGGIRCEDRVHFLALCAQIMRRIVVDHARQRGLAKRGGNVVRVSLDEVLFAAEQSGVEVLALNEALDALAAIDSRKSRLVELRYFGGLNNEEVAEVLGISVDTAKRDWRMARAWLFHALTASPGSDDSLPDGGSNRPDGASNRPDGAS